MHKKIVLLSVSSLISLFLLTSCNCIKGSGKIISEQKNVPQFHSIEIGGNSEISITQGHNQSLEIKTDDNVMPLLKTEVENGKLVIKSEGCILDSKMAIKVTMEDLKSLNISGSSKIKSVNKIKSKDLKFDISGASEINMELEAETLSTVISGAGKINLSGEVVKNSIDISGAGEYNSFNLKTKDSSVKLSESSEAKINASDKLDVQISGSGKIEYKGKPKVTNNISGSGEIKNVE